MKDEPRSPLTKHQLEHPLPTVIHHPEDDMPLLEQWLRRGMANPGRFWTLGAGVVVVLAVLAVLGTGFKPGGAGSDKAWIDVTNAKTAGERTEAAKEFPNTIAAHWALLQAASEYYNEGFADLPANRDAAGAKLQKAQGLFEEVSEKAPKDSPLAREAALGLARTYEARNMLEKAIKQYENVAKAWPDTAESRFASARADELRKPESEEFYKQLYAFKPSTATLPPGGSASFPGLPPNHPPILPGVDPSSILVPPPPVEKPANAAGATTKDMPAPVLLPPAPKAEEKKAELPADVFAPGKPKP